MSKKTIAFSITGALMTLVFLIITNYLTSPSYAWSIYPIFLVIYWPIGVYFITNKKLKTLSLISSIILIAFLVTINYMTSPVHPWFLYSGIIIIWPVTMYSGKWAKTFSFSIVFSIIMITYYMILNYLISPAYPWSIYTTFTFIWWPLITYFFNNKKPLVLSIISTLLISSFFIIVNYISSPYNIWAIYPIFAVLWWPLSIYYFKVKGVQ